ncbi:hypothetical protein ACFPPF_21980 [Xenophilus aerolatus]|nr:hypothetical protein [Xenophilus aerolatus]
MGKKAAARQERKARLFEKFEAAKASLVARVNVGDEPKVAEILPSDATPRLAPHLIRELERKEREPKAQKDGSRFESRMTWCITQADREGHWPWKEPRDWTAHEWETLIRPPLTDLAALTWAEIDRLSSDTGHRMHHGHELSEIRIEAQRRWLELDLEQFDTVFRFRIGGQKSRAWGFVAQAHFHLVWWDREHSIYPTDGE